MPLDPQIIEVLKALAQFPKLISVQPEAARQLFREQCALLPAAPETLASVEPLSLDGADFAAALPARLYRPSTESGLPLILFFHGGGFVVGDLDTHDGLCRRLAAASGCALLSVAYRLAPEHHYPAAAEDAYAALRWAREHAALLQVDAARIALAGDSAGGNVAAAAALRNRDAQGPALRAQLLLYPTLQHPTQGSASYTQLGQGYGLTLASLLWYWQQYLPQGGERVPGYAAPLQAEDHRDLPPTLVITAEYDLLRDEGERYAALLHEAGVSARASRYEGMNHGFAALSAWVSGADRALREASDWLRAQLHG